MLKDIGWSEELITFEHIDCSISASISEVSSDEREEKLYADLSSNNNSESLLGSRDDSDGDSTFDDSLLEMLLELPIAIIGTELIKNVKTTVATPAPCYENKHKSSSFKVINYKQLKLKYYILIVL